MASIAQREAARRNIKKAQRALRRDIRGRSKRRGTHMAKRASRRRGGMTLPMAAIAGFLPYVANTMSAVKAGGLTTGLAQSSRFLTGFDPTTHTFSTAYLWEGAIPIIIGLVAHRLIGGLGVNRMLARARIPFVRI